MNEDSDESSGIMDDENDFQLLVNRLPDAILNHIQIVGGLAYVPYGKLYLLTRVPGQEYCSICHCTHPPENPLIARFNGPRVYWVDETDRIYIICGQSNNTVGPF
jgi:hypothetical protein